MLVLASASPRRREVLSNAGLRFEVRPASIDERPEAGESAEACVIRLARAKAEAVVLNAGEVVLGADTVVRVDGMILGKPASSEDAARMLHLLSGRWHEVLTGVCVRSSSRSFVDTVTTRVHMLPIDQGEIDEYVRGGEPMDKAGAYAIQGIASRFIDRIEGCYFNVVGLPVARVFELYRRMAGELPG